MHIIVLEDEPSSRRGGQELNLLEICQGLYQRGHSISLIYLKAGNLLPQYQKFCTQILQVNSFTVKLSKITQTFKFLADTGRVSASKNSIVFANRYQDVFWGFLLKLFKNIPLVCHLQLPPPVGFSPKGFSFSHGIGLKGVDKFIAVSNQTKLDWVKSGFKADEIDVVHNGTNTDIFKPVKEFTLARKEFNLPEEPRIISYIGRLDREKGIDTLLKAFALLLQNHNVNTKLIIAGKAVNQDEKYKEYLEHLITTLNIEDSISFLGHIANTTSLYQASDLTVLPSVWSEPFGRTVVESMACGTPVVASRTGGIPEILTGEFESGLFEPGNEQDMSYTLGRMIDWRQKDPQLGERCRAHILSKFSVNKMIDSIEKILLSRVK